MKNTKPKGLKNRNESSFDWLTFNGPVRFRIVLFCLVAPDRVVIHDKPERVSERKHGSSKSIVKKLLAFMNQMRTKVNNIYWTHKVFQQLKHAEHINSLANNFNIYSRPTHWIRSINCNCNWNWPRMLLHHCRVGIK